MEKKNQDNNSWAARMAEQYRRQLADARKNLDLAEWLYYLEKEQQ